MQIFPFSLTPVSNISANNDMSATWDASLDNNGPHIVPAENTTSIPGVD